MVAPRKAHVAPATAAATARVLLWLLVCTPVALVALDLSILSPFPFASSSVLTDCAQLVGRYNKQYNASIPAASVCDATHRNLPHRLPSDSLPSPTNIRRVSASSSSIFQQLFSCTTPARSALPFFNFTSRQSYLPNPLLPLFNALPIIRDGHDQCSFPTKNVQL